MPGATNTFGLPAQTYVVHKNAPAAGVEEHRVVMTTADDRRVAPPGSAPALAPICGVTDAARGPGESVAVRELGEALVEVSAAVDPGDDLVIADNEGRVRAVAAGDVRRVGTARSRVTQPGGLVVADLAAKNTERVA